jgi:hypothetical protein
MPIPLIGFEALDLASRSQALVAEHFKSKPDPRYAWRRGVLLGEAVLQKARIYLDTNYWAELRNAAKGRSRNPDYSRLLEVLRVLVASGKAVCPTSDAAFLELVKDSHEARRVATAKIMDDLSQGVALRSLDQRVRAEVLHAVRRCAVSASELYPVEQMVWTRSAFALQMLLPRIDGVDPDTALSLENGCHDLLWGLRLGELLAQLDGPAKQLQLEELAQRLTAGKFAHAHELRAFDDALRAELHGTVDAHGTDIDSAAPYVLETTTGDAARRQVPPTQALRRSIAAALFDDRTSRAFPTINIQAGIHAAYRWNRSRRFRKGDGLDIMHASAALPYCSAFLTERPLASVITSTPLQFDVRYGGWVEWDPGRAALRLSELA